MKITQDWMEYIYVLSQLRNEPTPHISIPYVGNPQARSAHTIQQ